MAKDGTMRGGARVSAGRKPKALKDKLDTGNPGRRKLTVVDFTGASADLEGLDMPPPKEYLAAKQKNGKDLVAAEVYTETWKWLADRGCAKLVPQQLIEQYSMAISRWIQCEESITEFGFLAKHPTTGSAIPSPYVAMSQSFCRLFSPQAIPCRRSLGWRSTRTVTLDTMSVRAGLLSGKASTPDA